MSTSNQRYSDLPLQQITTTRGHAGVLHTFTPERVKVKVPHANAKGKHGKPISKDFDVLPDAQDPNKPGRLIINLAIEHPDGPGKFVNYFDPPLELRVEMTDQDIKRAGGKQKVKLVYWNPTAQHWEQIPDNLITWFGDEIEVTIHEWPDDPAIGSYP